MLNTTAIKKNNNLDNSIIQKMTNETIIDQGIREIEDATNTNDDYQDDTIAKSFHAMENRIFSQQQLNNDAMIGGEFDDVKKNFNFPEITGKYSDEDFRKNIIDNEKKLLISVSEQLKKYSVFDESNNLIGYFTIEHIIKYLGQIYDTKNQFIKNIDINTYNKSKELIKTLIFKLKYSKKDKYVDFEFKDYTTSGFMGDIELLIKLNNLLYLYQNEHLQTELSKVDLHDRAKIEINVNKFIFLLLNYTLKLISITSDKLKNIPENKELKDNLLNYSISLVYRINLFVQEQLKVIHNQNKSIKESIDNSTNIKQTIKNKITELVENIKLQNELKQTRHNIILSKQRTKINDLNSELNEKTASSYYDYSDKSNKSEIL